jgi:hypothetical protein
VARSRGLETRGKNLNGNIIITTGRKRERERQIDIILHRMCVRDPIVRRKGQKAPARKSHVMKAEKEWNTDCYSNKSSSSNRKRQIMSLLNETETTTRIEKDAADNKRMQLEMKKNAADSSSSAMLMVTRDLMCAEVVVEEQQIHIHQIQKNCCNNNEKEEERTEEDQSAVLLRDLMCGEVLQWPTEIYNGSTESLRFCTTMLPFDDYTKTRANSTSSRCSSILLSSQQHHQDEVEGERLLDPVKNKVRENFEEAMGVLLKREGLIYYKLSTVYLQSLKAGCKITAAAATEDSSSCGSTESSLSSSRRRSVNWIFKVSTTHKTHIQSQPPSPNLDSRESCSNLYKISLVKIVINNCCKSLFLCVETLSSSTLSSACQDNSRPNNTNSHIDTVVTLPSK